MLTRSGLTSATAREQLASFAYDALGRRVAKRVWPAQALRTQQTDGPDQATRSLPPPSFNPPKGAQPHTSAYLWEGNRLLQEITGATTSSKNNSQRRTYVFEPGSFIPMLRIDETQTEEEQDKKKPQKQEHPTKDGRALEAKNTPNFDGKDEEDEPDNFAALKAQAWDRMVPGQISLHLSELREQAEKLRLPEKANPSLAIRVLHYHCDHLGTPRELTDEDGKLVWSAEYLAWGKLKRLQGRAGGSADGAGAGVPPDQFWHTRTQPGRANHLPEWVADNTGNVRQWREAQEVEQSEISQAANDPTVWGELTDQSIRFQGQWHDQETGLHYNRFRYYDPDIGRFIHQDPIGLDGGFNLYMYAHSPSNGVDPFGLCSTKLNKGLAGVAYDGKQAHHIIPEEIWKRNAGFFDKIGMGNMMDHRSNGVLMPSSAKKAKEMRRRYYHCGSHDNYSSQTEHGVQDIKDRFKKGKISAADARMEIARLQEARRITLTAPLMPGQSPVRIY